MAIPIYQNQTFFAPQFLIKLKGQNLGNEVMRDVLSVTYKDDLENLDTFEFTLHDWDPVSLTTKYSSPYDQNGQLHKIRGTDFDVPNFEPGAEVELHMGYYGANDPVLMMAGKVASSSVSFPAAGNPTFTVRVMNLLFDLQRSQETLTFEDQTPSQIAEDIARHIGVEPKTTASNEATIPFIGMNNEYPIVFLARLARLQGYDIFVTIEDDDSPRFVNIENDDSARLFFGLRNNSTQEYELEWGKSLIDFTPTLKLKDQVERVVVRGWNPEESGNARVIEGEATWNDLEIHLPDAKLLEQIEYSTSNAKEEITDQPVSSQAAAEGLALAAMRRIVQNLITGTGNTVGVPQLRAGSRLQIKGLGLRYSGPYLVTASTHKIDESGYTTEFSARMEVVRG